MDIRLVKERAFSNYEVTGCNAVVKSECRLHHRLRHLEDENAKDDFTGSDPLRQPWAFTMLSVVGLLCGLGDVDVYVVIK